MRSLIVISLLLIGSFAKGQDTEVLKRIDFLVSEVDSVALGGTLDSLKNGILNVGGTSSDIFVLKQGQRVQKITVLNKSKNYSEKIVFKDGKPVFAQFSQPDGAKWTFYLVGENAYYKDGDRFNKGSGSYWYSMIDAYLYMFRDQIDK